MSWASVIGWQWELIQGNTLFPAELFALQDWELEGEIRGRGNLLESLAVRMGAGEITEKEPNLAPFFKVGQNTPT